MPQQQKTDAFALGDLPELTDHQQAFVREFLSSGSATKAQMAAYDCSAWSKNAIYVEASRNLHHPKISLWIRAARMAYLGNPKVSLDGHITELERIRELAIATGNYGAAVNAEVSRGKAAGHYVERHEDVTTDPEQALKMIAEIAPDIALQLAQQDKITWPGTKH